jgi:hypothetical protein
MTLIGALLVNDLLPAQDRISKELAGMHYRFAFVEMALGEIDAIYRHLQDMVPGMKASQIGQQRLRWQERLENALRYLEKKQTNDENPYDQRVSP